MIALPGLCLATGRPWLARNILRTFARFVSEECFPITFRARAKRPNTTPWMRRCGTSRPCASILRRPATSLLRELFPVLEGIMDAHVRGTRYNIHVDPADGLLYAGEPGVQLTWMDAKVGDRVVTPRIGKPVEVNALWLNAAASMARFARALGQCRDRTKSLRRSRARRASRAFGIPRSNFASM